MPSFYKKLTAFFTQEEFSALIRAETGFNKDKIAENRIRLASMPEEKQIAFGYLLLNYRSTVGLNNNPGMNYLQMLLDSGHPEIPKLMLPVRFIGYAGKNSEVGPAYRLEPRCFAKYGETLFYTDEDISRDGERAGMLAEEIAAQSGGIKNMRAGTVSLTPERPPFRCVYFETDSKKARELFINGKRMQVEDNGGCVLVIPKTGEYCCQIGEVPEPDKEPLILETRPFVLK